MKFRYFFLLPLLLLVTISSAAITEQSINDASGQLLYRVYESTHLNLGNQKRSASVASVKPQLKLSLRGGGVTVDKIDAKTTGASWTLTLSDATTIDLTATDHATQTEFNLVWHGTSPARELCFHYSFNQAHWYAAQNSKRAHWPLDPALTVSKSAANFLLHDYWLDEIGSFKRINELLYLNSDGFAVALDPLGPWFAHRDPVTDPKEPVLCFSANTSEPYYRLDAQDAGYLDLKVRIFAGANIRTVLDFVIHDSGAIPKPTVLPDERAFTEASWMQWSQHDRSDKGILAFTHDLEKHGLGTKGEIFTPPSTINSNWEIAIEHSDKLIADLHTHGYRIGYSFFVQGFDMLWAERAADWNNSHHYPEFFPDFSDPTIVTWFESHLGKLRTDKHADSYLLHNFFGQHHAVYNFSDPKLHSHPNALITKYVETLSRAVGPSGLYSFVGFRTQHLPVVVQIWNDEFDVAHHFSALIPNVLALSIAGYSFLAANPVGTPSELDEEMYIRWVQATTFLPHMSFHQDPWSHNFSAAAALQTKRYLDLHGQHATTLIDLGKKRLQTGAPIVRSLWYVSPDDPKTYPVADEYMVGDDLLVAPVLVKGARERTVYLPTGTWIDQQGKSYVGPAEFKVAAPLEELPYFKRKV